MIPRHSTVPLPMSRQEMRHRGWNQCDVVLVSGDAYVDHPSFGIALIARWLEKHGYRVGIIAQPDWRSKSDFMLLGRPRLFFGVSSGNVDSMVANYSAMKQRRQKDDFSPGRQSGLRPDRAVTVYANRIREAYGDKAVIVLGGIEASLRRLAHYDYWDNGVRRSILFDSRAQILVYGMGEYPLLEIASRLDRGDNPDELDGIRGTATIRRAPPTGVRICTLPSYEEVSHDKEAFNTAFKLSRKQMEPAAELTLVQAHGDRMLVVSPPPPPLSQQELDDIYAQSFTRTWHPRYSDAGGIPALETVRYSVSSHRGCSGECSFCSLFFHQGRIVASRSQDSILKEIQAIAAAESFRGTITDIGGPTANLYGASCDKWKKGRFCHNRSCLTPDPCPRLNLDYAGLIRLYRSAMRIPRVKHVFVASGLRYDLLLSQASEEYLRQICRHQISGFLKVAPEHNDPEVLELMNKPPFERYEAFYKRFVSTAAAVGKKTHIVNYLITDHPGTTLAASYRLAGYLRRRRMKPEQVQDFLPSPMTRSTAMFHTGKDPVSGRNVTRSIDSRERRMHRALLQPDIPAHRQLLDEALRLVHEEKPRHTERPHRGSVMAGRKKTIRK